MPIGAHTENTRSSGALCEHPDSAITTKNPQRRASGYSAAGRAVYWLKLVAEVGRGLPRAGRREPVAVRVAHQVGVRDRLAVGAARVEREAVHLADREAD